MPKIAPFSAVRPTNDFINQVAVNSHLSPNAVELTAILQENPFSYYHIFKPQFHFNSVDDKSGKFFKYGKNYFNQLKEQQVLKKDPTPVFYFYKITQEDGNSFTGIIAKASASDYANGLIKKHEHTLVEKERLLARHIEDTGIIGEPVLLSHPSSKVIDQLLLRIMGNAPDSAFEMPDKTKHELWLVSDNDSIQQIQGYYASLKAFYIADGHHRCASMYRFIEANQLDDLNMLAYIVPDNQLKIYPFYRMLATQNELPIEQLKLKLSANFNVLNASFSEATNLMEDEILLCNQSFCLKLQYKASIEKHPDPAQNTNVAVLERYVLNPVFDVVDSRNDERLTFCPGKNAQITVDSYLAESPTNMVFYLPSITPTQIAEVSDFGSVLPPKSTYIEPKLLSGAVILEFP